MLSPRWRLAGRRAEAVIRTPGPPAVGGLALIVACFLGSAVLRVSESAPAVADEIGSMKGFAPATGEVSGCEATDDADILLLAIREREGELDRTAAELDVQARQIGEAEEGLRVQLAAFEEARAGLEATLAAADGAAERDIDRMTTVYENMKPDEAALIFEEMDVRFAAGLLARMRPELAASVLSGMKPDAAYALTLSIASRNTGVPLE